MDNITLSDAQWAIVKQMVAWYLGGDSTPQVFYLAGYAGVGKSTMVEKFLEELQNARRSRKKLLVETATFTGKAAHVLRKKGVENARTIHSLIYIPKKSERTGKTEWVLAIEGDAALADLIVLDEVSMVNEAMAKDVLSFGKKTLVIGDPGQLPPVRGAGAFTNREPDAFLTEVHRQAMDSPILRLATLAREGKVLPLGDWTDAKGNVTAVVPHTSENQYRLYRPETQPICGIHRVRWGYTKRIRKRLGFEGDLPMVGETVMCLRNDRDEGIFNGMVGTVSKKARALVDGVHWRMDVDMEDRGLIMDLAVHPWAFQQHTDQTTKRPDRVEKGIHEFDYGYVLTCHKAQGSGFPDVTVVDDGGAFRADSAKWRYTAVTRASESLTFLRRM